MKRTAWRNVEKEKSEWIQKKGLVLSKKKIRIAIQNGWVKTWWGTMVGNSLWKWRRYFAYFPVTLPLFFYSPLLYLFLSKKVLLNLFSLFSVPPCPMCEWGLGDEYLPSFIFYFFPPLGFFCAFSLLFFSFLQSVANASMDVVTKTSPKRDSMRKLSH